MRPDPHASTRVGRAAPVLLVRAFPLALLGVLVALSPLIAASHADNPPATSGFETLFEDSKWAGRQVAGEEGADNPYARTTVQQITLVDALSDAYLNPWGFDVGLGNADGSAGAVSVLGDSSARDLAVSGIGNSHSQGVALSGVGDATSCEAYTTSGGDGSYWWTTRGCDPRLLAVSGIGNSNGIFAVTGVGTASACETRESTTDRMWTRPSSQSSEACTGIASAAGVGRARGPTAVTGVGHAGGDHVAVAGAGSADGGPYGAAALVGHGSAEAAGTAISGVGESRGSSAFTGFGRAYSPAGDGSYHRTDALWILRDTCANFDECEPMRPIVDSADGCTSCLPETPAVLEALEKESACATIAGLLPFDADTREWSARQCASARTTLEQQGCNPVAPEYAPGVAPTVLVSQILWTGELGCRPHLCADLATRCLAAQDVQVVEDANACDDRATRMQCHGVAATAFGSARGLVAISVWGDADTCERPRSARSSDARRYCDGIAVSVLGDSRGFVALSVLGDAETCGYDAQYYDTAWERNRPTSCAGAAVSGAGEARGGPADYHEWSACELLWAGHACGEGANDRTVVHLPERVPGG